VSDTTPVQPPGDSSAPGHEVADDEAAHSDFAVTRPFESDPNSLSAELWPESADGQCSQSAALFAASQPAPLNVV